MDDNALQRLLKTKKVDDVASDDGIQIQGVVLNFNEEEAKGQIVIERCGYGARIWVNGVHYALVDLFLFSKGNNQGLPRVPQIVLYEADPNAETFGRVKWLDDKIQIEIDRDVVEIDRESSDVGLTLTYELEA